MANLSQKVMGLGITIMFLCTTLSACKIETSSNSMLQEKTKQGTVDSEEITNKGNSVSKSTVPQNAPTEKESIMQDVDKNQTIINNSTIHNKEIFFGEWTITQNIARNKVSAYGKSDIEKMIGKKITYSENIANFDTNSCINPSYKQLTIITKEEDDKNFIKFKDLGIVSESVIGVEVYTDNELRKSWIGPGSFFYIKDENTIIVLDDGVFFELVRTK